VLQASKVSLNTSENVDFHLFFCWLAHCSRSTSSTWYTPNGTEKQMKKQKQAKKREEDKYGITDDGCLTAGCRSTYHSGIIKIRQTKQIVLSYAMK
jgi:hypothetical protein